MLKVAWLKYRQNTVLTTKQPKAGTGGYKMNEYISREDVLKKAKSSILVPTDNEWDCGYNTAMAEMQGFIKQLPAADVQPVKYRRWIGIYEWAKMHDSRPSGMCIYFWCSECQTAQEKKSNFCPNCGARMRGTSND